MGKRGALASHSAQVSMEYMMVIAFVFVIMVPFLVYFFTESGSTTSEANMAQLSEIARKIAENAEKVYAFGAPTTLTLSVYMPNNVQAAYINGTEIAFVVNDHGSISTVVEDLPMNASGHINVSEGNHKIRIKAVGSSVVISEIT